MSFFTSLWDSVQETAGEVGQTLTDTRESVESLFTASDEDTEPLVEYTSHHGTGNVPLDDLDVSSSQSDPSLSTITVQTQHALARRGEDLGRMETTVDRMQSVSSETRDLTRQLRESRTTSSSTGCCTLL